jgi:predicted ArsR family transcriptional regulator
MEDPRFEELGTRFRVTLRRINGKSPVLDPMSRAILDLVNKNHGLSTKDLAAKVKRSPRATRTQLQKLVDYGYIVEVGSSRHDPHRAYYPTDRRISSLKKEFDGGSI